MEPSILPNTRINCEGADWVVVTAPLFSLPACDEGVALARSRDERQGGKKRKGNGGLRGEVGVGWKKGSVGGAG